METAYVRGVAWLNEVPEVGDDLSFGILVGRPIVAVDDRGFDRFDVWVEED